jgi:uncharacterized protein (TIGR02145 family)
MMNLRVGAILLGILSIGCSGSEFDETVQESKPLAVSTVQIGDQVWMAENLAVRHYRNGDSITFAETAKDLERFGFAEIGAWMYPNGDSSLVGEYGLLYNWFAVTDDRGIAPEGWHVPSDDDWQQLAEYLGADSAGTQLKVLKYWKDEGGGTNSSGFSGMPAGFRHWDGTYEGLGIYASWWSTTILEEDSYFVWFRGVGHDYNHLYRERTSKFLGMSLRMIQK